MEQASVARESPASTAGCDWSKLQADLLVSILGILEVPDLFSSGAVCKSWRISYLEARRLCLCSPNQSPCLVYSSGDRDANTATLHNMSTNKLYHITLAEPAFRTRYVMGGLITADERSNLIFVNPATRAEIAMPPPETMKNVRLRYSADGILDGYDLLFMDLFSRDFHTEEESFDLSLEEGRFYFYTRVVLSCDPSSDNCMVLRAHFHDYQLSYARVGDTQWTWIDTDIECWNYHDILYNNNDRLFYAVRATGEVVTIDLNGPSAVVKIILKGMTSSTVPFKYIVQAPWGDFFQIWKHDRYDHSQEKRKRIVEKFLVYKIDFAQQRLVELNHLQDHALFIGFNTSFLLPAKDFSMLIPNSIYHTDDQITSIFCNRFNHRQVVVFSMKDNSFSELLPPSSSSRLNWSPPVWIQPSLT